MSFDQNKSFNKISVAQMGARRHYAVPLAMHNAGVLATFYTDLYMPPWMAKSGVVDAMRKSGIGVLQKIGGRHTEGLPPHKVRSFNWFGIQTKCRAFAYRRAGKNTASWLCNGRQFCDLVASDLSDASANVYAFTSAAKELFQRARELGGKTYLDHATAPRRQELKLVQEERERFSSWANVPTIDSLVEPYHERQLQELELADVVICGSSFAKRAICAEGFDEKKVHVVPLGIKESTIRSKDRRVGSTVQLRVLFVGNDGLRKGIGYLNEAVSRLNARTITTRAIGDLGLNKRGLRELGVNMEILGNVPRQQIANHFDWADVLVLPSVSDTFGLVVLEALAASVPVIVSTNTCGADIIRDGVEGFVVNIRDSEAIGERLEQVCRDRQLLNVMSDNARSRAYEYTIEKYGGRLVSAIDG